MIAPNANPGCLKIGLRHVFKRTQELLCAHTFALVGRTFYKTHPVHPVLSLLTFTFSVIHSFINSFRQPRLLLSCFLSHSTIITIHYRYKFLLAFSLRWPRTERLQVQTRRKASVSACTNTHLHYQRQLLLWSFLLL